VKAGQQLAGIPASTLAAALHAPCDATVAEVTGRHVILACN
jgi:hypothetical protein